MPSDSIPPIPTMDFGPCSPSSAGEHMGALPYFQILGRHIEKVWSEHSYNEEPFSQLALDVLSETPPTEHITANDIIDWTFSLSPHYFRQPNGRNLFGQPPVTLFQGPRFYIEALFWLSGTTDVHEHSFSGAFAVLSGSSVHSHWQFLPDRAINSRMLCGRLERVATEILRPGSMRMIYSGDRLIHQLFHLDVPSVTIVIRTYTERNHLPQFNYLLPGLAIDSDDYDSLRARRLIFLESMVRGQIPGLHEYALRMVESGDLETVYHTLSALSRQRAEESFMEEVYRAASKRHGEIVELFRRVCEGLRRTRFATSLRARISNPEARFFLALLMLMPDREAIFYTIRAQFPDLNPLEATESWLNLMSGKENIGFDLNDVNRCIFRCLVEGLDADRLLSRLQVECLGDPIVSHHEKLLEHSKNIARSILFHALFSESPLAKL